MATTMGKNKSVVVIAGKEYPVISWSLNPCGDCNTGCECCAITPIPPMRFKPTIKLRAYFMDMVRIARVADELRAAMRSMMMRQTRGNN